MEGGWAGREGGGGGGWGLEVEVVIIVEKRVGRERLRMRMLVVRWGMVKGKGGGRIVYVGCFFGAVGWLGGCEGRGDFAKEGAESVVYDAETLVDGHLFFAGRAGRRAGEVRGFGSLA